MRLFRSLCALLHISVLFFFVNTANHHQLLPHASISEDRDTRYLHLGDTPWIQGAMHRRKPGALVLQYIQRMMAWLLWADLEAVHTLPVVQLGLGAAALTRYTSQVLQCPTTAVEINPHVIFACHQWFDLPHEHEHLLVVQSDALHWLQHHAPVAEAHVIQTDMYDQEAAAPVLDDEELYAHIRTVLRSDGMFVINLFGRDARFEASLARIQRVFGRQAVCWFAPTREGNSIVLAHNSGTVDSLGERQWQTQVEKITQLDSTASLKSHTWRKALRGCAFG